MVWGDIAAVATAVATSAAASDDVAVSSDNQQRDLVLSQVEGRPNNTE